MFSKLNKFFLYIFLLSIFFFKIPNFYIFPFFKSAFLTTQALSRVIIILTFFYQITIHILYHKISSHKKLFTNKNSRLLVYFILIFFILQSLSVFAAVNISSFLSRYKDIIVSFVAFFVFFFYRKYYRQLIYVLLISVLVNSFYQFLIIFYQKFFINIVSYFIYQKHIDLVIAKFQQQNRIYLDTYDEIILPFIFILSFKSNVSKNLSFYILFIFITFFSLISNIRSRILMLFVGVGGSLMFIKKINPKKIFVLMLSFLITGFLINNLMRYYSGYSFVDRILLTNEATDIKSFNFRLEQIKNSLEIGKASLFGVGLGNYYDNLTSSGKNSFTINKSQLIASRGAQEFVHNVFGTILAESGYISVTVFLVILIIFIKKDIKMLKTGTDYQKAFIISFWSLFSYGLLNPAVPASYQVMFWGIRGLIIEN